MENVPYTLFWFVVTAVLFGICTGGGFLVWLVVFLVIAGLRGVLPFLAFVVTHPKTSLGVLSFLSICCLGNEWGKFEDPENMTGEEIWRRTRWSEVRDNLFVCIVLLFAFGSLVCGLIYWGK